MDEYHELLEADKHVADFDETGGPTSKNLGG